MEQLIYDCVSSWARENYFEDHNFMLLTLETNIHQIGNTVAWCLLLDISIVAIHLKHNQHSLVVHSILGWVIFALTYVDILLLLIPNGFNVTVARNNSVLLFIHGILGLCMMAFVVVQVAGGVLIRLQLGNRQANLALLAKLKKAHMSFGYFLAIVYKINIIWSWAPSWPIFGLIIVWEACFVAVIMNRKLNRAHLKEVVTDSQTASVEIRKVHSVREIDAITKTYVIFQNYAYHAHNLASIHPGGSRVIETVIGREVDRFLFGMYSSELLPSLGPHSHSANCLRLAGRPFAQLVVAPTFDGFTTSIVKGRICFVRVVSEKTQIYQLGLRMSQKQMSFRGYTDLQQLGQYYSVTADDQITRLYTAVNFLTLGNVDLMHVLLPQLDAVDLTKNDLNPTGKMRETELSKVFEKKGLQESLLERGEKEEAGEGEGEGGKGERKSFIPIMLKIYPNGKFTSMLKQRDFRVDNLRISCPMGRGLQLDSTPPGRIIVLAGGTGLFPFCDMIDLLFKAQLLAQGHQQRQRILRENLILEANSFSQFSFLFLVALNEPEDIHPITLHQLIHLSLHSKNTRVVMRVSKNPQQISALPSKIEFTKDYFNKRVLSEAAAEGLARVWICGPPKLSSDTALALLESGIKRESFLLV